MRSPISRFPVFAAGYQSYLELGIRLLQQNVDGLQLLDVSVALELLARLGANLGDLDVELVHLLDFRSLLCSSRLESALHSSPTPTHAYILAS